MSFSFSRIVASDDFENFHCAASMLRSSSSEGVEANSSIVMVGALGSEASLPGKATYSDPKLDRRTPPGECWYLAPHVKPARLEIACRRWKALSGLVLNASSSSADGSRKRDPARAESAIVIGLAAPRYRL